MVRCCRKRYMYAWVKQYRHNSNMTLQRRMLFGEVDILAKLLLFAVFSLAAVKLSKWMYYIQKHNQIQPREKKLLRPTVAPPSFHRITPFWPQTDTTQTANGTTVPAQKAIPSRSKVQTTKDKEQKHIFLPTPRARSSTTVPITVATGEFA